MPCNYRRKRTIASPPSVDQKTSLFERTDADSGTSASGKFLCDFIRIQIQLIQMANSSPNG